MMVHSMLGISSGLKLAFESIAADLTLAFMKPRETTRRVRLQLAFRRTLTWSVPLVKLGATLSAESD